MEHAANRASVSHEMSTSNRGRILYTSQRGARGFPPGNSGIDGANIFEEPDEFVVGSHGYLGVNDCENVCEYPDSYEGGRSHA